MIAEQLSLEFWCSYCNCGMCKFDLDFQKGIWRPSGKGRRLITILSGVVMYEDRRLFGPWGVMQLLQLDRTWIDVNIPIATLWIKAQDWFSDWVVMCTLSRRLIRLLIIITTDLTCCRDRYRSRYENLWVWGHITHSSWALRWPRHIWLKRSILLFTVDNTKTTLYEERPVLR